MSADDRHLGLGGAEMARRDLAAVAELRSKLEAIAQEFGPARTFPRKGIVRILGALAETVGALMDIELVRDSESDLTIVTEHLTKQVLQELATAMGQLDRGVADEWLKPCSTGGTSQHKPRESDAIRMLLEAVKIIRQQRRSTLKKARELVAGACDGMRMKIRGEEITAQRLEQWGRQGPYALKKDSSSVRGV